MAHILLHQSPIGWSYVIPGRLELVGDETKLHAHKNDHWIVVRKGPIRTDFVLGNGEKGSHILDAGDLRYVRAGVVHNLTAEDSGCEYICLFSHFDEWGKYIVDPSALMTKEEYAGISVDPANNS